jgi:hypothetical protein
LLSKLLHNNHYLLMDLKQRFLFAFSMNLRKVRDLSIQQRKKLVPLWIAQACAVVFFLTSVDISLCYRSPTVACT